MDVNNIGLTLLAYFHNITTIEMLSMASEHIPYIVILRDFAASIPTYQ